MVDMTGINDIEKLKINLKQNKKQKEDDEVANRKRKKKKKIDYIRMYIV